MGLMKERLLEMGCHPSLHKLKFEVGEHSNTPKNSPISKLLETGKVMKLNPKIEFPCCKGKNMIEHLESQKDNLNLDEDDNLNTCFLSVEEIDYLIECVKKSEEMNNVRLLERFLTSKQKIKSEIELQIKHHKSENNETAINSLNYIEGLL